MTPRTWAAHYSSTTDPPYCADPLPDTYTYGRLVQVPGGLEWRWVGMYETTTRTGGGW